MRNLLFISLLIIPISLTGQSTLQYESPVKQRVVVLTDITNEPDDQESLVRLLVYSNEFDIEGIIATTSTHLRSQVRKDKIESIIRSYGSVKKNLDVHASGYPTMNYLLGVTSEHLPVYSMEGVGNGKDSKGSDLIIHAADKNDERPLWISVWGGANCLAQALWKVRETRNEAEVKKFVSKLKVYSISDQDFSGQWIRENFPDIFYIVDPSAGDSWLEYYKAAWTGISGDRHYKNGPGYLFHLVDNPWLAENIRENHGPLGENYIKFDYIMEGDTPSFLGLINNGLGWYISPAYGGWGGRYELYRSYAEKGKIWTSSIHSQDEITLPDGQKEASNQATIWRWREAYQSDFAARMDWNILSDFKKANHNPVIALNGNTGKNIAVANVKAGDQVTLTASGSIDPDGDNLYFNWFVYNEAGSFKGRLNMNNPDNMDLTFIMPDLGKGESIHLILEVKDSGSPSLFSYRRIILNNP